MKLDIRRLLTAIDHKGWEAGQAAETPLRRVAITAILANPWAGRYAADLTEGIAASAAIGDVMARAGLEAMGGHPVESYGKGGVVGLNGEQEHANALLTTTFAEPLRLALGGALAWIPSFTKLAAPGATIDVPLAHKDALYVRSHYDGVTVTLPPEAPAPDEVALIIVLANRGRLNARVGGLTPAGIAARDGLR
ncbi:amino acid synthesis family protein [Paracraurococcus lichenis]|uniref:Amino acid synthesis family protein n=1 Tax=Paracraurococcus lichenis TaxID=3064888 RepID=A0ABT9E900_9PROT|nr:amino acid synthesis family protein [Paracraurococcus sp. LOR1-02]MDO9712660.1 amino acid synthesis family protein [Paracraurococcus sp. LOR1-02]